MNPLVSLPAVALLIALGLPANAQQTTTPSTSKGEGTSKGESTGSGEPKVQTIVIEDEGSRIEELRVRGVVQRIVVKPKVGTTQGYEIITGDGSRDLSDGANTSRGAAGKRVWHVLSF